MACAGSRKIVEGAAADGTGERGVEEREVRAFARTKDGFVPVPARAAVSLPQHGGRDVSSHGVAPRWSRVRA